MHIPQSPPLLQASCRMRGEGGLVQHSDLTAPLCGLKLDTRTYLSQYRQDEQIKEINTHEWTVLLAVEQVCLTLRRKF
jgi:hypothetical protein